MRPSALVFLAACGGGPPPLLAPAEPKEVVGLSFPASYLAQRVGEPRIRVKTLLPPGQDARTWQPDGAAVAGLASANLIVANGAGYEG